MQGVRQCSARVGLRVVAWSLVALSSATMTACTGTSRDRAADALPPAERAAGFEIDHDAWADLGYRWDWTGFPYVSGRGSIILADVSDGVIAVHEDGGTTSLLETDTGKTRWSSEIGGPLGRYVGIARPEDGRMLVASDAEAFILQTETGDVLDRQRFENIVTTEPLMVGDVAVFGTPIGQVVGHQLTHGLQVWAIAGQGAITTAPIRIADRVVAVTSTGQILFVSAYDGRLIGLAELFDGTVAEPVTDGSLLFVASLDQSIYAFDPANASLLWRHRTAAPIREQPAVLGGTLYCTVDEGFRALEAGSGRVLWTNADVRGRAVATVGPNVMVWGDTGATLIDPATGQIVRSVVLEGVRMLVEDGQADPNLYAISRSGVVAKFVPGS